MTGQLTFRATMLATALAIVACGDNSAGNSTTLVCAGGASGTLGVDVDAAVTVVDSAAADLVGAQIAASMATTLPGGEVSIECATDINPPGTIALGPAVSFGPAGTYSGRAFELTLPFKAARLPDNAGPRHVRIVARRHLGDTEPFFPTITNRIVDVEKPFASRARFRAHELVTYQVVADEDAGSTRTRRYTYRAVVGISMGGSAALTLGLRHHDKFDHIIDLGGEPGPSMVYSLSMIRDYLFGGFCTAADEAAGRGNIGQMCLESQRPVKADQHERKSSFESMLYEEGEGVGLTLRRSLYVKAARDLSRAYGNPAHYNPDNPYLPPGVPDSFLDRTAADRCANPVVLTDFFDREFNPTGANPVITFCDAVDSETLGLGVFNPALTQDSPIEILLAVDLNGNGVRDSGEPVVTNAFEPFADIGTDGVADVDETGPLGAYDAVTNPDPAGDNFDALRNPRGTEQNEDRDEGEPFEDVGIDGIASTCQSGDDPGNLGGCYDYGEGDGEWNITPNLARWYDSDIDVLLGRMTEDERDRINIWSDAGIRDFLNASVSANAGAAIMMAKYGINTAIFDQFAPLTGSISDAGFDFFDVPYYDIPRNVHLRYGNPDAELSVIENGDGRHVGTALQLVNRVTTSFTWLDRWWPNGDRDDVSGAGVAEEEIFFTPPTTQRETPFALFLPPGYNNPENANRRYPVVYFLHGYGQEPGDLVLLSGIFESYMRNTSLPNEQRFQKFIMVYVDGRCRPNQTGVPVPAGGDGCEGGTFYLDAPLGGPAQMETNMLELIDYIDATYRTKREETVEVID